MQNGRCAIAVMAKAPRPGKVKTRLQPALPPDAALALSAAFLRDTTENIRLAAREAAIDPWVAYTPAGTEPLFHGMLATGTRLVLADGAIETPADVQGFGRSLLHAARALFEQRIRFGLPAQRGQPEPAHRLSGQRRPGACRARRARRARAGRGWRLLSDRHEIG